MCTETRKKITEAAELRAAELPSDPSPGSMPAPVDPTASSATFTRPDGRHPPPPPPSTEPVPGTHVASGKYFLSIPKQFNIPRFKMYKNLPMYQPFRSSIFLHLKKNEAV